MSKDGLVGKLGRICAELPDDGSVTLPVRTLRAWLSVEPDLLAPPANEDAADLTVAEVATRLRRSPSAVRSWLATGLLSGYRLPGGKAWRVPRAALAAFREAQRPKPRPTPTPEPTGTDLSAWRRVRGRKSA